MATNDGDGWVQCRCGRRHWGRFGAAGLVLLRGREEGREVLLQLRADWTHQGGTWGMPGGARDSHEDVVAAALREAEEETGADPARVRVLGAVPGVDHRDWSYTYVLALAPPDLSVRVRNAETTELRWSALPDVPGYPLHPALRSTWPDLVTEIGHRLAAG